MSHPHTDRQGKNSHTPQNGPTQPMIYPGQAYPQPQYPMPMMYPVYMPNMGYYGHPGMTGNPFGQSQYNIPQLDNHGNPRQTIPDRSSYDQDQSWQPSNNYRQPKTKEEYLERFNKELFPKLGRSRLVRLQAVSIDDARQYEAGIAAE